MPDVTDPKDLQPTFEDVFDGLAYEALQILYDRQRKYGPHNIARQGLYGVFLRIRDDKIARIERAFNGVLEKGVLTINDVQDFDDETFEDALFDVSNLALIMVALKRRLWGKPMREDTNEIEVLAASHPDGVPQLTLTPEEEEAERARAALAGDEGLPGKIADGDDLADLQRYLNLPDDWETPEPEPVEYGDPVLPEGIGVFTPKAD